MAAALPIRDLSGATRKAPTSATASDNPATPVNPQTLTERVEQLTNTVNELIKHFNAHQHSALNAAPSTDAHTGAGATAQNLFTSF